MGGPMRWIIRMFGFKSRAYRKKGVYFIRARFPRRGYPIDIHLWESGSDVGYRYRGLMPWELSQILESRNPEELGYIMFQHASKAYRPEEEL